MFIVFKLKRLIAFTVAAVLLAALFIFVFSQPEALAAASTDAQEKPSYIKWVDYTVPLLVMTQALEYDVDTYGKPVHLNWIELLAYASAKNGGKFRNARTPVIDNLAKYLKDGGNLAELTKDMKYYSYYLKAYTAVLGQFLGEFEIEVPDKTDNTKKIYIKKYGLKVFSPIARGYSFCHYDDFGNSRSYGFSRKHLGNDLMGSIGTPIVAVEGGFVEALGWNQYGGWRIGIRSFDGFRYYYYAHLRKDNPYVKSLAVGSVVKAGDVIGYLGMTGYSTKENKNNIKTPHLHFGMQLIFDESQKDGINQIWINVYHIVNLLQKNRSAVKKDTDTKDFIRVYDIYDPAYPE